MEVTKEGTRDIKRYPKNPTYHDQHRWRVGYHGVYRVLKQVYPYLIVKKEKAKQLIDHYDKKFKKKTFGKGSFGAK
jgi:spore coat polysaccharide biosynthesis protein SpsF (cytidylyltransferase family)